MIGTNCIVCGSVIATSAFFNLNLGAHCEKQTEGIVEIRRSDYLDNRLF